MTAKETILRKVRFLDLLKQRKVWGVTIGSGAYNYCFYLLLTWLPVYLESGLRLSARAAVLFAGVPWIVAAAADFLIGGYLVDRLIRGGSNADTVRRSVLIGGTALGLFIFAPALLHESRLILICLSLSLSGLSAAAAVLWTVPTLLSPPGGTGRLASVMNLANTLAAITAPVLTGYLRAATHSFVSAFAVAGVVLLLGVLSYSFLLGRIVRLPDLGEAAVV